MLLYLLFEMVVEFEDKFFDIEIVDHSLKEVHLLELNQIYLGFYRILFVLGSQLFMAMYPLQALENCALQR